MLIKKLTMMLLPLLLAACSASVPGNVARTESEQPHTYPDYHGVTVPPNIAPLNFMLTDEGAAEAVAHLHGRDGKGFAVAGPKFDIPIKKWRSLLQSLRGDSLYIDVYAKAPEGWVRYAPMALAVAREEIDPYISYRLIEPSYVAFEDISIAQRCLENFEQTDIANNSSLSTDTVGQCLNCHSYQDYNRGQNMQLHVRLRNGGTIIAVDGKPRKVNLKTPATISAGVYPSWHPTLPLIAYSNNNTTQIFHSRDANKVEVQDSQSDLILYDVEKNTVQIIANESTELETFPYWSRDGRWLYYATATVPELTGQDMVLYQNNCYDQFKYNLMRRSFDPDTRTFGPVDTVFMASDMGMSATFPRESADGRFLVFTMAPYGTFHIWHKDADLYSLDLESRQLRRMDEVNSDDVESYHSFSSNGRWMIFSSRRDDGSYTRLYIAYYRPDGTASKPFVLPQRDPEHNAQLCKSYNIPEFMAEPVKISPRCLRQAIESDALEPKLADI